MLRRRTIPKEVVGCIVDHIEVGIAVIVVVSPRGAHVTCVNKRSGAATFGGRKCVVPVIPEKPVRPIEIHKI